jgi:hypothetical protein
LLEETGSSARPLIKVPGDSEGSALAVQIVARARLACQLARLAFLLPQGSAQIATSSLQGCPTANGLKEIGFREVRRDGGRFRSVIDLVVPEGIEAKLRDRIGELEDEIDDLVEQLY